MKNMKKIGKDGRVSIPLLVREAIGLQKGDVVDVIPEGHGLRIIAHTPRCIFCGVQEDVGLYQDKGICGRCREELLGSRQGQEAEG